MPHLLFCILSLQWRNSSIISSSKWRVNLSLLIFDQMKMFMTECNVMRVGFFFFAGGAKWSSLPPARQAGHHQRAARVSHVAPVQGPSLCCKVVCVSVATPLSRFVKIRFQKDRAWSETGDRYLLKLFRDHLFHQVTEAGAPWIDLSHIVSCLNKVSQVLEKSKACSK